MQEESLIEAVRALPPAEAGKVLDCAQIQWSDFWSDEDLADATAASIRGFDSQEGR